MNFLQDPQSRWLISGIFILLVVASVISWVLRWRLKDESHRSTLANLEQRIRAWWVMVVVFLLALFIGPVGTCILFGLISFLALREFITLTPTRRGDHRTLFWVFFIITPIQYYFLSINWYGMFSIFIPVYAFLFIPIRSAIAGDYEKFLERVAKMQWGLMICVYCVSFAPAILFLSIERYEHQNAKLLLYLVMVVQLSDVLQYVWGKALGRRRIAPNMSPNKTWEGFIGGILTATLIGTLLYPITPFTWWQSAAVSLSITLMGFAGGLTLSAIKRDRGIKDYGNLIEGHGGIMDRIDSLCFSAPVFFHIVRYFLT